MIVLSAGKMKGARCERSNCGDTGGRSLVALLLTSSGFPHLPDLLQASGCHREMKSAVAGSESALSPLNFSVALMASGGAEQRLAEGVFKDSKDVFRILPLPSLPNHSPRMLLLRRPYGGSGTLKPTLILTKADLL